MSPDELIGGEWIATSGYENGEVKGEPNCHPFEEGIEFKNEDTVYNTSFRKNFRYYIFEKKPWTEIVFDLPGPGVYRFEIKMISEDEMILDGVSINEERSCYLNRR